MTAFRRILVALDGSELSERGLGLLDALKLEGGVELTLLRVVGSPDEQDAARQYLEGVRGSRAETSVQLLVKHSDDAADQILEVAEAGGHDLLVLMTHGRGGLKRWVWGSVTERVVRQCGVPLLLGNARAPLEGPGEIKKILVPLDGSERAASVLGQVRELSLSLGAEVVLHTAYWLDPMDHALSYGAIAEGERKAAEADLDRHVRALQRDGVQATAIAALSEPAQSILKTVEKTQSDLIALTTHGRTGAKRWFLGSVAEKVVRASPEPVLLVRVPTE